MMVADFLKLGDFPNVKVTELCPTHTSQRLRNRPTKNRSILNGYRRTRRRFYLAPPGNWRIISRARVSPPS